MNEDGTKTFQKDPPYICEFAFNTLVMISLDKKKFFVVEYRITGTFFSSSKFAITQQKVSVHQLK